MYFWVLTQNCSVKYTLINYKNKNVRTQIGTREKDTFLYREKVYMLLVNLPRCLDSPIQWQPFSWPSKSMLILNDGLNLTHFSLGIFVRLRWHPHTLTFSVDRHHVSELTFKSCYIIFIDHTFLHPKLSFKPVQTSTIGLVVALEVMF